MKPSDDELQQLYVEQKLSYEEIARRYEVTRTSVMRWLRAAGISARTQSEATLLGRAKWKPTPEHAAKLRENAEKARAAVTPEGNKRGAEKRRGFVPPNKGKPWTREQREKIMAIRRTPEYRQMMSEKFKGENSPHWRGGTTDEEVRRMHGWEWRERRRECYRRDAWTCQDCGVHCGPRGEARIQAHHIVPRRYGGGDELENLVTLCAGCHRAREHRFDGAFIA